MGSPYPGAWPSQEAMAEMTRQAKAERAAEHDNDALDIPPEDVIDITDQKQITHDKPNTEDPTC
jgi:hypothetical protein